MSESETPASALVSEFGKEITAEQWERFFTLCGQGSITNEKFESFLQGIADDSVQIQNKKQYPKKKRLTFEQARKIMGYDIILPSDITAARSTGYSSYSTSQLYNSLPSEELLRWCHEYNYAVIAAPPIAMTTKSIQRLNTRLFHELHPDIFAKTLNDLDLQIYGDGGTWWFIMSKEPLPESRNKPWREQAALLSGACPKSLPNMTELAWCITTYYEVRKIRLFPDTHIRTSTMSTVGTRMTLAVLTNYGLKFNIMEDRIRHENVVIVPFLDPNTRP